MKKGDILECEISNLAFGGAGVARVIEPPHDGLPEREFVVFVNGGVPGDVAKVEVFKRKRKFAEARILELVRESDLRTKPRCKYFGKCGGCKLQSVDYQQQLKFKQQQVQDAIQRIGGFQDFEVEEIIGCDQPWFYRNKMEFSFAWDDDPRKGGAVELSLGLHPAGRRYESLDIEECFLQSEWTVDFLNRVRKYARDNQWRPFHFKTGEGFARSLFVREGKWTGEVMVNLVSNQELGTREEDVGKFFDWLASEFPKVSSAYWTTVKAKRGQKTEMKERLMFGKETLRDEIRVDESSLKFDILPQAFFQPNTKQAGILYSQIFKYADLNQDSTVFDLFCGTGTIALFCAQKVGQVYGIELNASAIENAKANAQLNDLENVEFVVGDVGEMVTGLDAKPDVIVMDPPRAGVGEKTLEKVLGFGAKEIVYVSCNPSTLARDLLYLCKNGYELKNVQPVDMFPQTGHFECVGYLRG